MLKNPKMDVSRDSVDALNIDTFLKPKALDTFTFAFTGTADAKFLTKLSKLIKAEQDNKNVPKPA